MARAADTTRKRPVRSSINGRQDALTVEGKDPDKQYRIVNDTPGRVAKLQNMGWAIDEKATLVSSMDDSSDGNDNRKHVGGGIKAVAMSMPKDWYEDYQNDKQRHVDRMEKKTTTNDIKGGYGKVTIE